MPMLIGIILIPIVVLIIKEANRITTSKKQRRILNLSLILITLIYIIFCWVLKAEPFNFKSHYSNEYMIYNGEYILYTGIIFVFSPFMWIILAHFTKMIFRGIRIRKNAIIKRKEDYVYYRGDLDKIPHSIIMFTSQLQVDLRKCISATILKLKLTGYIEEKGTSLVYTNKDECNLYKSERMVLGLIRNNSFDTNKYKKEVEKETLQNKYLVKNHGGKFSRIIKIIVAICMPIAMFAISVWLDDYHFKNYQVIPNNDGHVYIKLERDEDIEQLYYNEVKDLNDYYHRSMADGSIAYNYKLIRADKLEYSVVRKALLLAIIVTFSITNIAVFIVIAIYIIIQQIIYFNKNYTTTIKGKILLNKAYALKNYLKDFSIIKDRTEKELILWEYYLIYAVALDVNVKIEDDIIKKYIKN